MKAQISIATTIAAAALALSQPSVVAADCIPVPKGGWYWNRFRNRLISEGETNTEVEFCGPMKVSMNGVRDVQIATDRDFPNLKTLSCTGGPCKIVFPGSSCECDRFVIKTDGFKMKGFHLYAKGVYAEYTMLTVKGARDVVFEDMIFEDQSWEAGGVHLQGPTENTLFDKCTFYHWKYGALHVPGSIKNTMIRDSLFLDNEWGAIVGGGEELTVERSAFKGNMDLHIWQWDDYQCESVDECHMQCTPDPDVGSADTIVVDSYLDHRIKNATMSLDCQWPVREEEIEALQRLSPDLMRHYKYLKVNLENLLLH